MSNFSSTSSPLLQRGVGTPPPSRPRLFARTSADRTSPPPPARLAPITPTATPALTPEPTPYQWEDANQRQQAHSSHASRHLANEEEEEASTPVRSELWWATASSASSPTHLLSSPNGHGVAKRPVHTRTSATHGAATARPAVSEGLQAQRVLLTPPRSGSGLAREGSAEASPADWSGQGRVESMLAAKRERFISSADTQHSVASSSTPPPRCKRAVSNNGTATAQTNAMEPQPIPSPSPNAVGVSTPSKPFGRDEGLRLSDSTSRSCSSRSAISDSSASDLVATVAATMLAAASSTTSATTTTTTAAGVVALGADHAATAAQCLVLDDSVDGAAVVSPAQLQRLLEQAAGSNAHGYPEEPPTPYRRRVITAEVLRDWTGWEDLELVLTTQLRVDAEAMIGVEQMGQHLPRLSSLKLNGSRIPRVRQLGTGFQSLRFLWLNSCHLTDLRGLAACCPVLAELYVSFNYLTDVTPVMALSATLEVLDVEGNMLDDAASLGFVLAALPKVNTLAMQGNPLTCEHQGRVRAAYAALVADEEEGTQAGAVARATPAQTLPERFSEVLRAWVRCLMPDLQTLNDEPMQPSEAPLQATTAAIAPARVPSARSVHVDPLDDRLAEELRLVEACVREMDPFDPLLEAVEASNQLVYTRPSTSCNGARPRLTPATAMGASRPTTASAQSSVNTSRRLGEATPTDASMLTTGAVLAGSATASLRRRLATPTPPSASLTSSLDGAAGGVQREGNDAVAARATSTRLGEQAHRSFNALSMEAAEDEDARVAALLADDSEEDEWEHYKSSLLQPSCSADGAAGAEADDAGASAAKRPSLFSLSSAAYAEDAASGAAAALEEDGFDKELKSEWNRLRMRMAKAGRA